MTAKKTTYSILLLIAIAYAGISPVAAKTNITTTEADFADFVSQADVELDLGNRPNAEYNLAQANYILRQNSTISDFMRGHFNKVSGKLYMESDSATALQYFNMAVQQFSGDSAERAEAKMFIGITYYYAGNYIVAENYFEDAKTVFESERDMPKLAQVLNNLGVLYFRTGAGNKAVSFCRDSLRINTEIENELNMQRNQQNLAFFATYGLTDPDDTPVEDFINTLDGGTGGSSSTITTSGSGTVVVNGSGGNTP